MKLEKLFNPQSIAIVGASAEQGKVGNAITKNILNLGYAGEVFLVNPKHDEVLEKKCYHSLSDIESEVDLAVVAIPAKFVLGEIEKNADRIKNYVIISAGFSETGKEGKEFEEKLLTLAQKKNLNILGPNCLGFIVPANKLNNSFAGGMPHTGNISFITQSGALAVAIMDIAKKEGIAFSNIISVGNKMQIGESELLEFMENDDKTEFIFMYLEGIKDGLKFERIAKRVARKKPVIILKAGRNERTQKAISSHTGALAGNDEIISAVFNNTGIVRVASLEELFDLFKIVKMKKKITNENTVVLTNAGGVGVLSADAFGGKNIKLAELKDEIKEKIKENLPKEASVENPIDLLGDAQEDRYEKTLEIISNLKNIGSVICILTPQDQTPVEKIADKLIEFKNKTGKLVVAVFLGGERVESAIAKMRENNISNFQFPEKAIFAMDKYFKWNLYASSINKNFEYKINERRKKEAEAIIEKAKKEKRKALYFSEAREIMEMYGVNTVPIINIYPGKKVNSSLTPFRYPVVLKVDDDKVLHKTDRQGVVLNIKDEKQLEKSISQMQRDFPNSRLIVESMVSKGMELIIGIKRDEVFGPVIIYGLGGIYTEFLKLVDYLILPLEASQIQESLLKGKLGFLFNGARGQNPYDVKDLSELFFGVSSLALEVSQIREFDINPVITYNNGKKSLAVDVKIIL